MKDNIDILRQKYPKKKWTIAIKYEDKIYLPPFGVHVIHADLIYYNHLGGKFIECGAINDKGKFKTIYSINNE